MRIVGRFMCPLLLCSFATLSPAQSIIEQATGQGQSAARDSAQANYIRAAQLAQEGRYGPAINALQRAIEYLPNEPQLQVDLATVHIATGNADEAVRILEQVAAKSPPYPPALMRLGDVYIDLGDTARANAQYRRLTVGNDPFPPAYLRLGDVQHAVGNREESIRYYRSAIRIDSMYVDAWLRLGSVLVIMDRYTHAIESFDKAADLAPGEPMVIQLRAMAIERRREYQDGVRQGLKRARIIMTESEEEAREVRGLLDSGADFIALAMQHSIHPSAEVGGDLGFFEEGDLIPEIESVASRLRPGEISPAFRLPSGWAIITRVN